ncbi:MAG: DUF4271 domain-containing protein [Psychroflexus sp.]|uniref:DUF4271 domain-containing protein n=1 Tax=Psychroflexus sp. S27 TaxID=1982757 RepID=UPI0018640088|nr:DUF4271 domain-containing protein [Psychroflexus sp. S27]
MQKKIVEVIVRHTSSSDWVSFIYLAILILIVAAKYINTNEFYLFFKFDFLKSYFAEKKRFKQQIIWFDLILFMITISVMSLSIMQIKTLKTNSDIINFSQIGLFFSIIIISKSILEICVGIFINKTDLILNYILFKIASLGYASLFILPLTAILAYNQFTSEGFSYTIIALFCLINLVFIGNYVYRYRKYLMQDWYYFILYICSLEIAPLVISYKWLNS